MKFQNLAFYESNWLRQNQNNAYNSACDLLLLQIIRHLQRNNCHFWPIFRRSRRLNQTIIEKVFTSKVFYIFMKNSFPSASKMLENPIFCFLEAYKTYIGFEVCNVWASNWHLWWNSRSKKFIRHTLIFICNMEFSIVAIGIIF